MLGGMHTNPVLEVGGLLGVLVGVVGVMILRNRSMKRSAQMIGEVTQRITHGELIARVPAMDGGIFGPLGERINAMADQLERRVQELESQRNQAQAILQSMVEGVCAVDRDSRLLWFNASAQRLFSIEPSNTMGKRLTELFRQPELDGLIREVLERHQPSSREIQVFAPQEQAIRLQATPCEGGHGGAVVVLVAQDVTQMRRLEGMRREFVANVSHELKTPLTSIKGLVETLLNGALEDSANNRRFVALIDEDTTRLAQLIDDLLALSQIESKAIPLNLQPVDLQRLINELVTRFHQQSQERQVTLHVTIAPDAPRVQGDPERLRQVFVNLLDNALKFNKPGGCITVSAQPEGAFLRIDVTDTGVGIPEQDLSRVFERFYRVDKARSRELGGTGLGLAIVKHLVELHRGNITVQSHLGHGSTFTITLPLSSPT